MSVRNIQIMINEDLLDALDRDEEVQRVGRSAVFRSIVADYLDRRRRSATCFARRSQKNLDSRIKPRENGKHTKLAIID